MALELKLVRYPDADTCTGHLYLRDEEGELLFHCDTLEHLPRDIKIAGKTGIPYGTYEIEFGMSTKFHRLMPYVKNVPNFTGIMIHPGNTLKDTQGCILVGVAFGKGAVIESQNTFAQLMHYLTMYPDFITITIKNGYDKEKKQCVRGEAQPLQVHHRRCSPEEHRDQGETWYHPRG